MQNDSFYIHVDSRGATRFSWSVQVFCAYTSKWHIWSINCLLVIYNTSAPEPKSAAYGPEKTKYLSNYSTSKLVSAESFESE